MPLIIPANTLTGGYEVANSCRFNSDAYMVKDVVSPTSARKYTISVWVKRSILSSRQRIFTVIDTSDTAAYSYCEFQADDSLNFDDFDGSSTRLTRTTNRVFRDPSAWMHLCIAVDTTIADGSAVNRVKMYINGTQETSFATTTNASQNFDTTTLDANKTFRIGEHGTAGFRFGGYMSEFVLIDGTTYAASDFGEFDEDSPTIWKPKDVSGLTFGNNGFYCDFESSGNLGNDANGGTDLTETSLAATDQATDTPTNNFCTMNPLLFRSTSGTKYSPTFSEGNTYVFSTRDATYDITGGTFMVSSGKWYFEWKNAGVGDTSADFSNGVGVKPADGRWDGTQSYMGTNRCYCANGNKADSAVDTGDSYGNQWDTNDILGCYLDLDNSKIYFALNGTMQNSADVSAGTGFAFDDLDDHDSWVVFNAMADFGVGSQSGNYFNFGNPAYTISSSNSDANGYGSFEYNPTEDGVNFYALCTKNLAEFGG